MNTFENEMYVCLAETFFHAENVDILWYMCSADHNYVVFRKDRRLMKQVVKHDKKESLMIWNGMRFLFKELCDSLAKARGLKKMILSQMRSPLYMFWTL